ncbi:MAG TPA: helical backbone metal receptor [Longimicrobiales bacterium]
MSLLRGSLSILALILAAAGCADAPGRAADAFAVVTDDAGREVRVAAPPARIISLIPAVTETVVALGAADRLVARTAFDEDPALAHLPSTEQALIPNVEWLARFRPELVVAWADGQSRSAVARLGALGIPVYGAAIETVGDVEATIRRIGRLLGLDSCADSVVAAMRAELDAVRRAAAGRERPSVFYLVARDPLLTAGPGTFIDELIAVAGGRNAFGDAPAGWPQVGLEEVVRRQPDVVLVPLGEWNDAATLDALRTAPGFRELRAVREGRVYAVDATMFNRPGPRIGVVAREIARLLHPEAMP